LCAAAAGSEGAASAEPLPAGLVRRFEAALSWLLCREPLQREVEGLACEARRWRVGFLAHDCALRPDGRPYRARCSRRTNRPQAARPSPSTWRAGEVAVPVLMSSAGHPCMRGFAPDDLRAYLTQTWPGAMLRSGDPVDRHHRLHGRRCWGEWEPSEGQLHALLHAPLVERPKAGVRKAKRKRKAKHNVTGAVTSPSRRQACRRAWSSPKS